MPKLGSGDRFKKLSTSLAARGAKNPDALAAWIGRRKFGPEKFGKLSAHGHANTGLAALLMTDGPEPYHRDADENVQCPNCKKYNDTDARYCDQCGEKLPDSAYANLANEPARHQALEFAGRIRVTSASDIVVSRETNGVSVIKHRRGGDKIGEIARTDDGKWVSTLDATGKALNPHVHQRAALMELVGTHNKGIATLGRPGTSEPLQTKPQQTELMARYGIPAVSALATPVASSSAGPRMTESAASAGSDQLGGLTPKGVAIYKKLKGRGFPHDRALSFAKRAQSMGGRK